MGLQHTHHREGSTVTDESLEENFSTSTCIKFTFFIQRKHHRRLLEQDLNIFFAKIPQGVLIPSYFFLSSLFPEFRSISSCVGEMHSGKAFFSRAGPWGRILCIIAILHLYLSTHTLELCIGRSIFWGCYLYIVGNTRHGTWGMGLGNNRRDDYEGVEKRSFWGPRKKKGGGAISSGGKLSGEVGAMVVHIQIRKVEEGKEKNIENISHVYMGQELLSRKLL